MGNMENKTKDHVLGIRISKDQLKELDRLRKKRHRSRADMMRILLLEELEREARESGRNE